MRRKISIVAFATGWAALATCTPAAGSQLPGVAATVGINHVADPPLPVPRPHFPSDDVPPRPEAPPPLPPPAAAPILGDETHALSPDVDCLNRLKMIGVTFEAVTIGPQPNPLCSMAGPVRLSALRAVDGAPIDLPDRPTVACTTGAVFADFVRALLSPLAKGSYGSPAATVSTGPGFECRTRDHIAGAKISAHGQGLAIDIAQVILADGRKIEIGQPKTEADQMFDRAARAGACGFFHTALGPGADAFHETHWHFDLEPRGSQGDARICQ